jgi:hypothetical protein
VSFVYHHREGIDVRNTVLATAVAAALALAAPPAFAQAKGAATKAEVQAIDAQMKALADRLDRLEASNSALKAENDQLKAVVERRESEIDYLKSQTKELREEGAVAANEISKVKGADWATKIKGRGDFRFRHEYIATERVVGTTSAATVEDAADRNRQRIRARLGFDAQVTDNVKATLLFATGGDDPRSSNQTLGVNSTRKSVGVDIAFVDWTARPGINVVVGKQPWPHWRPGNSLFFDGDYNPEGGAVRFDRGMLFGSAYGWWLSEQYNANPAGENSDGNVFGAQLGLKFPLFGGETRVAANYYDCGACQDQSSILFNNSGNGNTTYRQGTGATNFLRDDYEVLELGAEMGTTLFDLPFSVWANFAQNLAAERGTAGPGAVDRWSTANDTLDTAYAAGVSLGRASNPKTWAAALWYQDLDANSLFGQFIDSDFGDGATDAKGFVIRAGYAFAKNWVLNATYFDNTLRKDVGAEQDYKRLQVDMNVKF